MLRTRRRCGLAILVVATVSLAACDAAAPSAALPLGICGQRQTSYPTANRTYLVFFKQNSAEISPRGQVIIQELVDARQRQGGDGRIIVVGNVDAVEANTAKGLDLRRADAVRAALIADGLNPRVATLRPDGATAMLVPTDQPESQNRNVGFFLPGLGDNARTSNRQACADWVRMSCLAAHRSGSLDACSSALGYLVSSRS